MADNTAANLEASRQRMMSGLNTLSNVALGAGTAISAALGSSVKAAADFDSALHEVAANAGLNAGQFKKMHDGILSIAKDNNVRDSPAQLAKGLYNVISAGFSGQKALDVLHESAIGAAGGITDTMTASNALTTVLNSGIKGVDNERQAMDILLKIVEQGKMKFPELAANMGKVIPTAASFGVSIQDVGAALVLMTRQGQPVARATTDLTNLMSHIAHPSRQASGEFKKLGIEYGVNALKAKGLTGVMDDIIKRTKGHTDVLMKLFPELRAYRGAVEAAQNGGKTWHDILESLSHATDGQGQAMKAATEVNKGAEQQYAKMRQEITTLQTEIGEKLLPTQRKLMEQVRGLVKWYESLSSGTKSNILMVAEWGAGLLLAIGTIGKFVNALMAIRGAYLAIAGAAGIARAAQAGAAATGAGSAATTAAAAGTGFLARTAAGVGVAARVLNPAMLSAALLLAPQRAGASNAADARPVNADQEKELTTLRRRQAFAERQLPGATGEYADQLRTQIKYFGDQTKALQAGLDQQKSEAAAAKALEDAKNAAAKADMDYAKAGLAKDPFPGAKEPKAKKGKKKKDGDEEDEGELIADQIKNATKTSSFSASCAFFVSQVLKLAGAGVKGSDSVRQLWKNIADAGGEIVTGELKKGDILKFHGKNFGTDKDGEGKGNHTGIYVGDGMFTDSHDHNTRRTTRSLADYMKANPDADLSAMRLGDKGDRASNLFSQRADKQKDDAQTLKDNKDKVDDLTDALFKLTHSEDEVTRRDYLKQFRENYKVAPKAATQLLIAQMDDLAAKRQDDSAVELASLEYTANERKLDAEANARWMEKASADAAADYEYQEQKYKDMAADIEAAKKQEAERDDAIMEDRLSKLDQMNSTELLYVLDRLQKQKEALEKAGGTGGGAWNEKNRQIESVQNQIDKPLADANAKMHAFLEQMRGNVEGILGGAFQRLFEGDSKHFFSGMLKEFTAMLEQMAAKALALGIVNLLTGGAGGFLGGAGKGNGGFLSVFGFDDATNDTKAQRWGFDFGNKFTTGMQQYNNAHKPFGGSGRAAGGDTHIHVNMPGMIVREHADIDRITDQLAWKMKSGLSGRFVGTGP